MFCKRRLLTSLCVFAALICETRAGDLWGVRERSRIFEQTRPNMPRVPVPDFRDAELYARKAQAPIFLAPWVAVLAKRSVVKELQTQFFCNATMLSPIWAVTAAFCVDDTPATDLVILYGSENVQDASAIEIERIVIHPEYRKTGLDGFVNGIALLRLRQPAKGVGSELTIPGDQPSPSEATSSSVFGWGSLTETSPPSERLTQLDVRLVEKSICNSPVSYSGKISEDMFCAASNKIGVDVCQGFSGSGLVSFRSGKPLLLGLVSWGEGCGRESKPTVYISVPHFKRWIDFILDESR
jgi:secreted trypsin-like serine protease